MFMSSPIQTIIQLFLGKNMRSARDRAWDQVLASRGKGSEFWGPYVEEWQGPPQVGTNPQTSWEKWATSSIGRMIIRRGTFYNHMSCAGSDLMYLVSVLILPLSLYPVVGLVVTSGIKAVATARYLHKPYFQSKKMTPHEIAVFMKERKPEYYGTNSHRLRQDQGHDESCSSIRICCGFVRIYPPGWSFLHDLQQDRCMYVGIWYVQLFVSELNPPQKYTRLSTSRPRETATALPFR